MEGHVVVVTEMTCPCCTRYKDFSSQELERLHHRHLSPTEVVCDDCWSVFKRLLRKHKRVKRVNDADRSE